VEGFAPLPDLLTQKTIQSSAQGLWRSKKVILRHLFANVHRGLSHPAKVALKMLPLRSAAQANRMRIQAPQTKILTFAADNHMALKISLKPDERMIIGGAVIRNGSTKAELLVENHMPILRQKNILSPDEANTPARRIYLTIQLMYVDEPNLVKHHELYWDLVRDFISAVPRALGLIDQISEFILQTKHYDALKTAHKLIAFEQEVLERANQCS
jgi:flagellar biosynthesis repressor protein FlbT